MDITNDLFLYDKRYELSQLLLESVAIKFRTLFEEKMKAKIFTQFQLTYGSAIAAVDFLEEPGEIGGGVLRRRRLLPTDLEDVVPREEGGANWKSCS